MPYSKVQLANLHYFEWYGREGLSPKDSIIKYGIAAKCLIPSEKKYDCYAPDPDDDNCCIRITVCVDELIQVARSQSDVVDFLKDNGFMFAEFVNMDITDMLYYICQRYDIIAALYLEDPPTYLREDIDFK